MNGLVIGFTTYLGASCLYIYICLFAVMITLQNHTYKVTNKYHKKQTFTLIEKEYRIQHKRKEKGK